MAAHRYWRMIAVDAAGAAPLALTALHLYAGDTRVDVGATLTCTLPVLSGTLTDLQHDPGGDVVVLDVAHAGFALVWDYADTVDLTEISVSGEGARVLTHAILQSSDDQRAWGAARALIPRGADADSTFVLVPAGAGGGRVISLLHCDGSDGAQRIDDVCGSSWVANYAVLSADRAVFGSTALHFTNERDSGLRAVSPVVLDRRDLFSFECWAWTARAGPLISQMRAVGWGEQRLAISADGSIRFWRNLGWSIADRLDLSTAVGRFPMSAWAHVACTFDGTTLRIFVNGALEASALVSAGWCVTDQPFYIGYSGSPGFEPYRTAFTGYMDEICIVRGAALYTSDFTPPTRPFSLRRSSIAAAPPAAYCGMCAAGRGRILGTVKKETDPVNLPLRRRVVLYEERSRRPVAETWSNADTGAYAFTGLDPALRYTSIAYDHTWHYNATVGAGLQPEVAA